MKQLFIIFLLATSFIFAQQKDSVAVDDTTAINLSIQQKVKMYNDAQKFIDDALKKVDEARNLQKQIEGYIQAKVEEKQKLLKEKYHKVVK